MTNQNLPLLVLRADFIGAYVGTFLAQALYVELTGTGAGRWFAAIWLAHALVALWAVVTGLRLHGPQPMFHILATSCFVGLLIFPGMLALADPLYLPVVAVAITGLVASRILGRPGRKQPRSPGRTA